jgi:hypothetical protein
VHVRKAAIGSVCVWAATVQSLLAAGGHPAGGTGPVKDGSDLIPVGRVCTMQEMRENYVLLKSVPFGDPDLAYHLLIPQDWGGMKVLVPTTQSTNLLVPLGVFGPKSGEPAGVVVEVSRVELEYDVNPKDWLAAYAAAYEMRVLKAQEVRYDSRVASEMLVERVSKGVTYLSRLSASQMGKWLILVSASAREDLFPPHVVPFSLACTSFEFVQPPREQFVDRAAEKPVMLVGSKLTLRWPASWESRTFADLPKGLVVQDIRYVAKQEVLSYMRVKVYDRTEFGELTPAQVHELAIGEIEDSGMRVDREPIEELSRQFDHLGGLLEAATYRAYKGEFGNELLVATVQSKQALLVVSSLRPTMGRNPRAWMVARRAAEILLERSELQPTEDSASQRAPATGQ